MANNYVGLSVIVMLQHPPNTLVYGLVADINPATATLTLHNVLFPATGHRLSSYRLEGHAIADLRINDTALQPPSQHLPSNTRELQPDSDLPKHGRVQQTAAGVRGGSGDGGRLDKSGRGEQGSKSGEHLPQVVNQPAPQLVNQPAPQLVSQQTPRLVHQPSILRGQTGTHQASSFVDPAILSVGKRTAAPSPTIALPPQEAPVVSSTRYSVVAPPQEAPASPVAKNTPSVTGPPKERPIRKPSAATLAGPFSSLDIQDAEEADNETKIAHPSVRRASVNKTRTGKPMEDPSPQKNEDGAKKTRRGGKSRKKELAAKERRHGANAAAVKSATTSKGNGWRDTPMLQDAEETRTPGVIGGRVGLAAANASNRKTRRQQALEATNGWATEDATDIQELPEFDFESNLSKFDKRTVFNQIRNGDTTADEDRLVSFNRLARPGTHGGKNLHPTENVLDRKLKSATNTSSEEESDFGSGRNSKRAMSRTSIKQAPTRKGSSVQADLEMAGSGLLPRGNRSFINRPYASSHATGSPRPGRVATPPESPLDSSSHGCLRLIPSNRKCYTITPGGMLAVEEAAEVDFGLDEDLIAENAGRGIAEVALTAINPGGGRLAKDNPNGQPVIVVLAGNHRGGARAVAAARHLSQRGPKVMVALLGFERGADWDKDVRRQVDVFRKLGGSVRAWRDTEDVLKRLQAPPELIIDALLGRHKEFDSLGDADRRTVLAIVGWANKSRAACLAVETPSGVGGLTGEVAILEGEPLEVRAKYIVCLGAPRTGLLKALQNGAGRDPAWLIWVVDVGINKAWRNAGISGGGGKGVRFGEAWVVQAGYCEQ